jgi:hypothetical protein
MNMEIRNSGNKLVGASRRLGSMKSKAWKLGCGARHDSEGVVKYC